MTTTVELAVYDLSRGMARSLSAQFLGPQHTLDVIPHTGIVVFGKEYYFGSGIQAQAPHLFRSSVNLHPYQTIVLGTTHLSQTDFEAWIRSMNATQYSAVSYDLLHRNCNHFSFDASTFLGCHQQFPPWILQVPHQFLSSPMGQLIRPMLENMQVSAGAGRASRSSVVPAVTTTAFAPTSNTNTANPWAHLPTTSTTETKDNDNKTSKQDKDALTKSLPSTLTNTGYNKPSVLDSFRQPLRSSDTKTVSLCIAKVNKPNDATTSALWKRAEPILSSPTKRLPDEKWTNEIYQALWMELTSVSGTCSNGPSSAMFALMLLRTVLLKSSTKMPQHYRSKCLEWLQHAVSQTNSPSVQSLIFLTASNALAMDTNHTDDDSSCWMEDMIQAAITNLSHPNASVRQAVCACLYNASLWMGKQATCRSDDDNILSDTAVSLLCAMMEALSNDEPDETTLLRKLLTVGRLIQPVVHGSDNSIIINEAAKTLVVDLGLVDVLGTIENDEQSGTLAKELVQILSSG